jgi:2,5-furandicarboxylate decarboxylase 1
MQNDINARPRVGHNAIDDLRGWLTQLESSGRLAVAKEGVSLIDELAAISKRLEFERAVVFPSPGGHAMAVVANVFADRSWVAESMGVSTDQLCIARSIFSSCCRSPSTTNSIAAPI